MREFTLKLSILLLAVMLIFTGFMISGAARADTQVECADTIGYGDWYPDDDGRPPCITYGGGRRCY